MSDSRAPDIISLIRHLICVLLILITGLTLFLPMLDHWYFADDFHWLEMGIRSIDSPDLLLSHRFFNYYRPVITISFAVEHLLYGLSAPGHYLSNLLLHFVNALLMFILGFSIFKHRLSAMVAALFFLLTPGGIEAVIWISGRTDLLSTTLFLAAACFLLNTPSKRGIWLGNIAFILAIFSKEAAVMLPVILLLFMGSDQPEADSIQKRFTGLAGRYWITFLIAAAATAGHGILQWRTGPFIAGFRDHLVTSSWIGNITDGAAYTVLAPLGKIFTLGLPGWCAFFLLTLAATAVIRSGNYTLAKAWGLTILLMIPAALIPFDFLPEPHLTFRRFFYLPGVGASIFWGAVAHTLLMRKNQIITMAAIISVSAMLFLSILGSARQLQRWDDLTSARRQAMRTVRKTLTAVPSEEPVVILLPDKSAWREMFTLFSGRSLQCEYMSEYQNLNLAGARVFTFQQGALYPVRRRSHTQETTVKNTPEMEETHND